MAPGKVLCGLLKQIDAAQKPENVEDAASLEKTLTELKALEHRGVRLFQSRSSFL